MNREEFIKIGAKGLAGLSLAKFPFRNQSETFPYYFERYNHFEQGSLLIVVNLDHSMLDKDPSKTELSFEVDFFAYKNDDYFDFRNAEPYRIFPLVALGSNRSIYRITQITSLKENVKKINLSLKETINEKISTFGSVIEISKNYGLEGFKELTEMEINLGNTILFKNKEGKTFNFTYSKPKESRSLDQENEPTEVDTTLPDCFLTTAAVVSKNLDDNCYELETLRKFRDEYMRSNSEGRDLIANYYEVAPAIVAILNKQENSKQIYDYLFDTLVSDSIRLIELGELEMAMQFYKEYTLGLTKLVN